MKKGIKYLIIVCIILGMAGTIMYFVIYPPSDMEGDTSFLKAPSMHSEVGPYTKNISSTENIGAFSMNIRAERLFVKKGKFMGFNTSLQKEYVMNNLHMSLYKNRVKMIEISKDKVILNSFMRTIEIDSPQVIYPRNDEQPIRIKLDKENKLFTIIYQNKTKVWNLAK